MSDKSHMRGGSEPRRETGYATTRSRCVPGLGYDSAGITRHLLDCKGLKCPMPIVRLGMLARDLAAGAQIDIEADDPAFRADLSAWARRCGFDIVRFEAGEDGQRATVVKR